MIKVGQIGVGNWGKNLLRNFAGIKDVEITLASDSSPKGIAIAKSDPRIKGTTDNWKEVTEHPHIQAVVIATPPENHYEITKSALLNSKDVFVEKPITLDVAEAEEIAKLADEKKRILMVGHIMEYHPAVEAIKKYIDNGELGKIFYLYSARINLGKVRSCENALWSFAPHDISILLYLLSQEPVKVSATGASYLQKDIEDVTFVSLYFPDGTMGQIHTSWLDPHKSRKITIVGSKKMVVFDDMEPSEKIRIYDKGVDTVTDYNTYGEYLSIRTGDILIPKINIKEPLSIECNEFIKAIESRKSPRTDGWDGVRVLRVLECATRSLKMGGTPVKI